MVKHRAASSLSPGQAPGQAGSGQAASKGKNPRVIHVIRCNSDLRERCKLCANKTPRFLLAVEKMGRGEYKITPPKMQGKGGNVSTQKMSAMTRKIRRFHRLRRKICENLRYLRMVRQPLHAHRQFSYGFLKKIDVYISQLFSKCRCEPLSGEAVSRLTDKTDLEEIASAAQTAASQ